MAKINRYNGNYPAFASEAENAKRTIFGTTTTGVDDLTSNINAIYRQGWEFVGNDENPTMQDFNAAFYTMSQTLAYLHQMGIPEWTSGQQFQNGSYATDPNNGELYRCKTANHTSSTPPRNDSTNWTRPDAQDADTVDGLHAESFMRRDNTPDYSNGSIDALTENVIFAFGNESAGAIPHGSSYDAVGIQLEAGFQRTQIASIGSGLHVRSDDVQGTGWNSWKQIATSDEWEGDLTDNWGWRRSPDGFFEQWGGTSTVQSNEWFSFPIAFEDIFGVQITARYYSGEGGYEIAVQLVQFNNGGFEANIERIDGSGPDYVTIDYRAFGK